CNNIESVTLSYGIQSIGGNAFSYCEKITSVYLPSSLIIIGSSAFSRCSNIKEVHIDDIKSYLAIEFGNASANPVDHEASLYIKNELAEDLVIPEGVTS
ncbi:MAG: leucine-rich repeat protein, partial [Bacillota bacterium]|nr:leucine-rich repeat protein [Bacillota bacterium]